MLRSIDPATGEAFAEYEVMAPSEVNRLLRASSAAFARWSRTAPAERASLLSSAAAMLRTRASDLARLITREMGKPVREARGEIEKCARACDYYAGLGPSFLQEEHADLDGRPAHVACRPLGPLLAIMPWNFPFWQSFRAAAPALMAGNTVVLKLAGNTTGCALAMAGVLQAAGFPEGVFTVLRLPGDAMGRVVRHATIAAVTLTGSTAAGRKVAAVAAGRLKKTVLELGGSDPYLVLEDADLELAARICARARLINAGQSCIAAKRFIVAAGVHDEFLERLVAEMRGYVPADPMREETRLGPLARRDVREEVHGQVQRSLGSGARLLAGGETPAGPGWFYPPTVLAEVQPGQPAFDEELFGPVAAVVRAHSESEAIDLANRTAFGLGAAVFTRDTARAARLAREELHAGLVAINDFVQSDPRVPFGGVKDSGYGRELGAAGLREFANLKTILGA